MATTFRIASRDGDMCLTAAPTGENVDFRRCNQYDAAQLWERKDYGPLGTAIFQKGRGCLHADCLLDRNEQACASGLEIKFAVECDVTKGVPASLWAGGETMKHSYKGKDYCVHASAIEGGKASMYQCPDTGVPEIRFIEGELTQSSLAAANVFMHALRSDATGKCIGADDCSNEADAALSLNPTADAKPGVLWNAKRNQCFDVDLPSQRGSDGQWRVADGYPKVITGEDPAVRVVGRFKDGACRAKFRFADGRLRATIAEGEEFCLDGESMRLVACSATDANQGWKTRPTGVAWIDPPRDQAYQAPPPEESPSPEYYYYSETAPAPGPAADAGTLEWLAKEKWFWPIVGVVGVVLLLAIGATMFYFFK